MASSPCISVCQIEESSRLCRGCGRSLREIGGWATMTEAERLRIMALLPRRLETLEPPDMEPAAS
ncbi:MAG: DUF1289 domain-containing protein [Pseudomonadota bacterium]